ncbi:MAG TPA: glycerate kinase, partial [Actinomycetota bacterium]|nr:glycerate kinase [Actinomycetota bacterium]
VLRMARDHGCRTVLVAGQVDASAPPADLVYSLADRAGLEAALARPSELLEEAAAEAAAAVLAEP